MKIILATFLYETELGGGAAAVVNQLAQLLVQAGHAVVVLTTHAGSQINATFENDIKIIRLPASNLYWVADKDRQPLSRKVLWQLIDTWNPIIYRLAREVIIREAPDIFHSHKLRGLSPSIWNAAATAGVKTIVHTCHDFELLSPEGLLMGRVGRLAREQNLLMRPYQGIRRHVSRFVHFATAPSRFVLNLHQKMGFFPSGKARIIPNSHGLDTNGLQKNALELSLSNKRDLARHFLYLGRLDKAKGIDLLCEAFLRLTAQRRDYLLRIAGWGPLNDSLREKYKSQNNIVFTGPVFGTQKTDLLRDSDVLIAPSVAPENFPLVIAEAYSFGVPVITSTTGAFPEIVRDGETGLLFNSGSANDLFSALVRVSEERHLIRRMSETCMDEAHKYTTENILGDYLHIYEDNG
jgi:glycosyltransferase involved in cell wall biosynthesis